MEIDSKFVEKLIDLVDDIGGEVNSLSFCINDMENALDDLRTKLENLKENCETEEMLQETQGETDATTSAGQHP